MQTLNPDRFYDRNIYLPSVTNEEEGDKGSRHTCNTNVLIEVACTGKKMANRVINSTSMKIDRANYKRNGS